MSTFKDLLPKLKKEFGDKSIISMLDEPDHTIPVMPTGILALDIALGGGIPKGRLAEISGAEGAGKTAIAMMIAAQAQKDGVVVLVDAENAFNPTMAINSNVNIDDLYVAQPESLEDTLEMVESLAQANDVSCVIIDSVAALVPRAELEGDYGDAHVALVPRLMSQGLRKLNAKIADSDSQAVFIWINQVRDLVNAMGYGPKTTTPGGRALRHFCSTRIEVKRIGQVKQAEEIIGHTVKATVTKNRVAPPFKVAQYDIIYKTGISNEGTVLDAAVDAGLITRAGAWYSDASTGEKLGQGRQAVLSTLREDQEMMATLTKQILS